MTVPAIRSGSLAALSSLAHAGCWSSSSGPDPDAGLDGISDTGIDPGPDTPLDPAIDGTSDVAEIADSTDPLADPPDGGYLPACWGDASTSCCTDPPVGWPGAWECVGGMCMWQVDGGGLWHITCHEDGDCDCLTAPVRCMGAWQCIHSTCWYFCD